MSSDKIFHFHIGELVICVEDGHGYGAPDMPDGVALSVRERTPKGKTGARKAASFDVQRNEIAAIGIEFLDLAHRMAPETLWARSETVASVRAQQRPVMQFLKGESKAIADALKNNQLTVDEPLANFEKLRKRIHILQRAQFLLERIDDRGAQQIDVLLTLMEHCGYLPFDVAVMQGSVEDAPEPSKNMH